MVRCPVHDELHEADVSCPRLGMKTADTPDGDCEKHRQAVKVAHERKRVLADGGQWDDKKNQAVT